MFIPKILSGGGNDDFDSLLEKTRGSDPNQNAWLTVELKVALNFVDATNPVAGLTLQQGAQWFALDSDRWMFPMVPWDSASKKAFLDCFQGQGENAWNYQFVLITPADYTELDVPDYKGGWMVRPNVICLFRLRVVGADTTVLPSATISGNLTPHRTINVVRLNKLTTTVTRTTIPTNDKDKSTSKSLGKMTDFSWRSNSGNYDDLDSSGNVMFGHELGHALGEGHIRCLGTEPIPICATDGNDSTTYGTTDDPNDRGNRMGGGSALTLLNAQPWTRRIVRHTYFYFHASQQIHLPPRRLSLTASYEGKDHF